MTWNSLWPDGTLSVKANETPGAQNTAYIETKQKLDHYWNEDSNNDGHHKKVEMPNISEIASDPFSLDANGDPTVLSAGMDCMIYTRSKTATEAPTTQQDEPFAYVIEDPSGTPVNHYMQLGFRAMIHFTVGASPGFTITTLYSHNCSVTREAEGQYKLTFTVNLPSANYIPFGTAQRLSGNYLFIAPREGANTVAFNKSFFKFSTISSSNSQRDPNTVTLAICGG